MTGTPYVETLPSLKTSRAISGFSETYLNYFVKLLVKHCIREEIALREPYQNGKTIRWVRHSIA